MRFSSNVFILPYTSYFKNIFISVNKYGEIISPHRNSYFRIINRICPGKTYGKDGGSTYKHRQFCRTKTVLLNTVGFGKKITIFECLLYIIHRLV